MMGKSRWTALLVAAPMALLTACGCAQLAELASPEASASKIKSPLTFGRLYEQHGNLEKAQELYLEASRRPTTRGEAFHRLAVLASRAGDDIQAEQYYERARRLKPADAALLNDLGYFYMLQGRLVDAERTLRQALRVEPDHERAWNNLAVVLGEQGRTQESLAAFLRVVSEAEAYANLAYLQAQLGEYETAAQLYQHALALDPTLTAAADGLAQLGAYRSDEPGQQPVIATVAASLPVAESVVPAAAEVEYVPQRAALPEPLPTAEPSEEKGIASIGFGDGPTHPEDDAEQPETSNANRPRWQPTVSETQSNQFGGWRPRR
jgi:Tfp pilus assembly protein PilF